MLSSLKNLSAQIHIFWREIFEICVFVHQIQVKNGFWFAPLTYPTHHNTDIMMCHNIIEPFYLKNWFIRNTKC